ncbi:MAG: hypothetical protein KDB80_09560 [Planctomycetes bacterium]|nr:hypothetical protein [Planctomycetota bacterium]
MPDPIDPREISDYAGCGCVFAALAFLLGSIGIGISGCLGPVADVLRPWLFAGLVLGVVHVHSSYLDFVRHNASPRLSATGGRRVSGTIESGLFVVAIGSGTVASLIDVDGDIWFVAGIAWLGLAIAFSMLMWMRGANAMQDRDPEQASFSNPSTRYRNGAWRLVVVGLLLVHSASRIRIFTD